MASTGDGEVEKRLSKQGGVRGQGVGRGKARMQGPLPGVLFGEEVGCGEGLRLGTVGNPRAVFLHIDNGLPFVASCISGLTF